MGYTLNMNDIPEELYLAFLKVNDTGFEDEEVYAVYDKLSKEYLKNKADDRFEQCRLMVMLTKTLIEIEENKEKK